MGQWRINLIFIVFILLGAVIIGRLVFIQVLGREFYLALAKGQQGQGDILAKNRKEFFIQDKNGNLYPLAINKQWPAVCVAWSEVKDRPKTTSALSSILGLSQEFISEKAGIANSLCSLIKNRLSQEEKAALEKENLEGVYLQSQTVRYYPQGSLASQTIGFLGGEGKGQYGLEGYYDGLLADGGEYALQRKSFLSEISDAFKKPLSELVLTLDYNIQSMAEKLLLERLETLGYEEAQIIVADPLSGKIMAMANFPGFDPNDYEKESDLAIFQNGAVQKIFEPGSVFKPFTMAAGLDTDKITPETTYQDNGLVKIGGYTIYNYDRRVWGERTMTEVLEKSINTGAVFAEQKTGHNAFLDYIGKFGFFEPTKIDLQGEIFSANTELKKGYEINFATASFGQGIELTPIQLLRAFSAIANGGMLVDPYLLLGFNDGEEIVEIAKSMPSKRVISQKTAFQVTTMLVNVIKQGYGKAAQIPGYYIAGKTGTAQISWAALGQSGHGYSDKTIQTFIGFAPAFSPRFLILVKLNNPQTKTAEYSAVPIFHDLAEYIIDYLQIPPDYE
jgi:cell division protein FtsI/penicillin-binding protein 2